MKSILLPLLLCLSATALLAQPVSKTMKRLPDTGQINSYTTTFGEDSDYQIFPPAFILHGNGTVTDTVTGLMWQKTDGGEMTIESAILYCDSLSLAGYSDWRLPNAHEAFSILNLQKANPAIDVTVFTNTGAEYWWTSDRQANDNTKIWCTNAGGGIGNHPKTETISAGGPNSTKKFHVRAVRDAPPPVFTESHFTDNGNGTITDNLTVLMWPKVPDANTYTWEQALGSCENFSFAGFDDWRLPNIRELQSLTDETRINPSVNPLFSIAGGQKFWSSTSLPNQNTKAWFWQTQFGITTYDLKTMANKILPVRGPVVVTTANESLRRYGEQLLAWPNPFSFGLRISAEIKGEKVELADVFGKVYFSGYDIENQDFRRLPEGLFFLKTQGGTCIRLLHTCMHF
jgi:hypothetical protein